MSDLTRELNRLRSENALLRLERDRRNEEDLEAVLIERLKKDNEELRKQLGKR